MMILMMIGGYHDADGDDRCVLGDPVIGIIIIIMEKKMRWILERGDHDMNIRLFCSLRSFFRFLVEHGVHVNQQNKVKK